MAEPPIFAKPTAPPRAIAPHLTGPDSATRERLLLQVLGEGRKYAGECFAQGKYNPDDFTLALPLLFSMLAGTGAGANPGNAQAIARELFGRLTLNEEMARYYRQFLRDWLRDLEQEK